jgi:Domain of unknown function (DUF3859)
VKRSVVIARTFIILLFACYCVLGSAVSSAIVLSDADFPIKAEIKDYGIYQLIDRTDKTFVAEATAGYSSVVSATLIDQTQNIPLKTHTLFGFNYAIEDSSVDSQWIPVVIQIEHPPTVNYLGHQAQGFKKDSGAKLKADGRYHNSAFYLFSESYEMVAGQWSISVIYRGERVLNLKFYVEGELNQ